MVMQSFSGEYKVHYCLCEIMNISMNEPINRLLQHVSKMQFRPIVVFLLTFDAYAERPALIIPQLY